MKKMIMIMATIALAVSVNAATVAWTSKGMKPYAGNAYMFFIIGENSVSSIETVATLLDAGNSASELAFGSGVIGTTGAGNNTNSGKSVGAGTYTSFMVLFDAATEAEAQNYVVLSGVAGQTQTADTLTAKVTFAAGDMSSVVGDSSNWKHYGDVPEPTTGLLLIVGGALLALRRKQK